MNNKKNKLTSLDFDYDFEFEWSDDGNYSNTIWQFMGKWENCSTYVTHLNSFKLSWKFIYSNFVFMAEKFDSFN